MKIRKGSLVIVHGGFRTEPPTEVKVEGLGEKNGRTLFDYNSNRWAYTNQIIKVVKY